MNGVLFILISAAMAIISLVVGVREKRKAYIFVFLLFMVALIVQTINIASRTRNLAISDEFFDALSAVDFEDQEQLSRLGFEKQDEVYVLHFDSDRVLCRVVLSYPSAESALKHNLKQHGNILYEAQEMRSGMFDLTRLTEKEHAVVRSCFFYKDNICITVTEDNFEKSKCEFERGLIDKIQNIR